jgi:photosystem II stability/assembly factor-like uncharacterized protein
MALYPSRFPYRFGALFGGILMNRFSKHLVFMLCTLGVLVLFSASSLCATQPRMIGPDGGDVRSLTYDPHNPDRILLGTSSGQIFESNDRGATWSRFARVGESADYVVDHVIFDPNDSRTIYVAVWSATNNEVGELFKSHNGGKSWTSLSGMKGKSIRSLAMAPSNPRILVAGALDGVFKSTDAGDSWKRISPAGHKDIKDIESLAIDPKNPEVIYAGTWHLAWKTNDNGDNWHQIKNGMIDDSDVFSIIVDPQQPSIVFASACSGIYKSTSGGELFSKIQGIPFSARRTRVLKQDPNEEKIVYAGTTEGLWKTTDLGTTWRRVTAPNIIVNDVMVDPRDSKRVLLATDRSGVLTSRDGATTFIASNNGFTHRSVRALLVDRKDANVMYAGMVNDKEFGGVFTSKDGGQHWSQMSKGLNGYDVFGLAQDSQNNLVAGTNGGLFRLNTVTKSWAGIVVPGVVKPRVADLQIKGKDWFVPTSAAMMYSHDGGRTWQTQRSPSKEPFTLARVSGNRVAVATWHSLLTSHDSGKTWGWMQAPSISLITGVAFDKDSQIWISSPQGMFHEKSSGGWEYVPTNDLPKGKITALDYDQNTGQLTAVVDSSNEVFASIDGRKWRPVHDVGFPVHKLISNGSSMVALTMYEGLVSFDKTMSARLEEIDSSSNK